MSTSEAKLRCRSTDTSDPRDMDVPRLTRSRTETKATTSWTVTELTAVLPPLLHPRLRASRYYSSRNDCLSLQAQTQRSRSANAEENRQKLFDELVGMYGDAVPGETSADKQQKHAAV